MNQRPSQTAPESPTAAVGDAGVADSPVGVPGVALWGILGVLAILGQAIWRLTPIALEPYREGGLSPWMWIVAVVWTVWMIYSEGYRGFQRGFAPRVVARAFFLARHPRWPVVIYAPLYCMGFFHATRKRLIVSWCVITGIATLVFFVHRMDQPWRGIVDTGVVLGLVYGAVAVVIFFLRAAGGRNMPVPPDVPEGWLRDAA